MTDMDILKNQVMLSTLASISEVGSNQSLTSDEVKAAIIKRAIKLYLNFKVKKRQSSYFTK